MLATALQHQPPLLSSSSSYRQHHSYRHTVHHHAPPTPPYESTTATTSTLASAVGMEVQEEEDMSMSMKAGKPTMPVDAPHLVDWLDFTRSRSAHFIAEKTCEMICYLWHATPPPLPTTTGASDPYPSPKNSPPTSASVHAPSSTSSSAALTYSANPTPATSAHQLHVYTEFVAFVQKILETTQVSQSVIVLSLHYIYKLKERTRLIGPSGSEYRIAVGGLMMANKFLDDNTYTNKTWSEVSGISLVDINKMEATFLQGVDYNLYVDKATYEAWLNLLKGLVMAKERDLLRAKGGRRYGGGARKAAGGATHHTPGGRARYYRAAPAVATPPRESAVHQTQQHGQTVQRRQTPRAQSTSPIERSLYSLPHHRQLPPLQTSYHHHHHQQQLLPPQGSPPSPSYDAQPQQSTYNYKPASYNYSPSPAPSSLKRSAATAFSPTSASFSHIPTKRSAATSDSLPPILVSTILSPPPVHSLSIDSVVPSSTVQQRPGITLQIPPSSTLHHDSSRHSNSGSSPMDCLPLQGFAKMNLDSSSGNTQSAVYPATSSNSLSSALGPMPGERERERERELEREREREREKERERKRERERGRDRMSTLVQPYVYSAEQQRRHGVPKHLYFYTLACSPLEDGFSRAPSPVYVHQPQAPPAPQQQQDDDYDMDQEREEEELELEYQREFERQCELELECQREREREREREKEKERERLRKARLRVHKPAAPSTIKYSDYACMPYVPSSSSIYVAQHPVVSSTTYHQPQPAYTSTQYGARAAATPAKGVQLPGPATIIAQTRSTRSSPVVGYHHPPPPPTTTITTTTTSRPFDAVRFEVERTQGYAPAPAPAPAPSTECHAPRPSTAYYTPTFEPVPSVPSSQPPQTQQAPPPPARTTGRYPYPQLSPPTPMTSTSTSPVSGVVDSNLCQGPCCVHSTAALPAPASAPAAQLVQRASPPAPAPAPTQTYGSPYSSLAGTTTYPSSTTTNAAPTTATNGNGYYGYERSCVSAYTSPAFDHHHSNNRYYQQPPPPPVRQDMRRVSPPWTYQQSQQQQAYTTHPPVPPLPPSTVPSHAHTSVPSHTHAPAPVLSAKEREELAYAQAQAQHKQGYDTVMSNDNSPGPGVPSMPFANAGPPGVCQMGYYGSVGGVHYVYGAYAAGVSRGVSGGGGMYGRGYQGR